MSPDFGYFWPAVAVKNQVIGAKSQLKQLTETFFQIPQNDDEAVTDASQQLVATLVLLTQTFRTAFTDAKRARSISELSDLGRLSIRDGQQIQRQNDSSQFVEILVDEYQDINQYKKPY